MFQLRGSMIRRHFNPLGIVRRKLHSARRLPPRALALAGASWLLLWLARLVLLLVPLRRLVRFYGDDQGVDPAIPLVSQVEAARAWRIRRAIALAVKYSPPSANCYPQALVARSLLFARNIPHGLFFGVTRARHLEPMAAHAWVMVGPLAVCGGNGFEKYTVVRCFITLGSGAADQPTT